MGNNVLSAVDSAEAAVNEWGNQPRWTLTPNWEGGKELWRVIFRTDTIPVSYAAVADVATLFVPGGQATKTAEIGRAIKAAETLEASTLIREGFQLHHAFPKYLGGAAEQMLEALPTRLHEIYHSGLDIIARRSKGLEYFQGLPAAKRAEVLKRVGEYTKWFDSKFGTSLYEAMVREGFPRVP